MEDETIFPRNHSPHSRSNYSRRYDNNYRRYDNIYRPTVQHINNNVIVSFDMRSDTGSDPEDNDHHSNKILFINTCDYQDQNYNDTGISTRRSHGTNTSSLTNNQRTVHLWNHPRLPSNSLEHSTGWWEANQIQRGNPNGTRPSERENRYNNLNSSSLLLGMSRIVCQWWILPTPRYLGEHNLLIKMRSFGLGAILVGIEWNITKKMVLLFPQVTEKLFVRLPYFQ